jgi:hypothetical protein
VQIVVVFGRQVAAQVPPFANADGQLLEESRRAAFARSLRTGRYHDRDFAALRQHDRIVEHYDAVFT